MSHSLTVLVTGAQGLLGRHIVRALDDTEEYRVLAVGRRASPPSTERVAWLESDLCQSASVQDLAQTGAAVIVHTAAVLPTTMDDVSAAGANRLMDAHVLRLAQETRASLIYLSSQSVYEACATPWEETQAVHPSSAYAAGKHRTEIDLRLLGLPTAALRISSPYSAADTTRPGVLFHFVREAVAGRQLTVMGDGQRTQDFVHGADVARAVLAVLRLWRTSPALVRNGTFNVASGRAVSMRTLAELVVSCCGSGEVVQLGSDANAHQRAELSVARACETLGWKPQVGLRAGVEQLVRHMRGSHEDWLAV